MEGHPLEQNLCPYPEPLRDRAVERSDTSSQVQGLTEIRSRLEQGQ